MYNANKLKYIINSQYIYEMNLKRRALPLMLYNLS